ncbi:MAG: hypothetical protein WCK57_01120 [Verrucomicrobiae bacterium]
MNNNLKNFVWLICVGLTSFGCAPWIPLPVVTTYYQLDGQREIKQDDHLVYLGFSKEPKTYGFGYIPRPFGDQPANCFILSVRGGKNLSDFKFVRGTYQYYSESPQPLELTWLAHGQALLFPTANIVTRPSPKRTEKTGEMKHGQYKIDIMYHVNGQDYECRFDVLYTVKNKTGVVGPWSGEGIH